MAPIDDRRIATRAEFERIAEEAAKKAVEQSMKMLFGVDIDYMEGVSDLREDLMRMRQMRKLGDRLGISALIAATTLVVSGAATFLWGAFKHAMKSIN